VGVGVRKEEKRGKEWEISVRLTTHAVRVNGKAGGGGGNCRCGRERRLAGIFYSGVKQKGHFVSEIEKSESEEGGVSQDMQSRTTNKNIVGTENLEKMCARQGLLGKKVEFIRQGEKKVGQDW